MRGAIGKEAGNQSCKQVTGLDSVFLRTLSMANTETQVQTQLNNNNNSNS